MNHVFYLKGIRFTRLWLPITFVSITGGLLVLIIFATLAYQLVHLNRIYPGVMVGGIEAGGMSESDLMAALNQRAPAYLSHPITVHAFEYTWTFTGQELGMRVDVAATSTQAYAVGRQGNLLADMLTQLRLLSIPRQLDPVIVYDSGPSNQVLQNLADQVYRPPQNAQLLIQPDGRVEVIPAQRGRQLHLDGTRPLLEQALFSPNPPPVQAVTQEIIPAIPEVDTARRQAENLLRPLVFRFETSPAPLEWRLDPPALVNLIDISYQVDADGQTRPVVQPNRDKFAPYIDQFSQAIYRQPVNAQLRFDDEAGQLIVVAESQDGRRLDAEAVYRQIMALPDTPAEIINLPVVVITPTVSSQDPDKLGIKQLVSEATSYFQGSSEGRLHNIELAASKFNGVIIPPGQIFSFNQYLGEVTKETGFDESAIIFGDRTDIGIGGGVCQVSTTAFRAAFFGGYELLERWAHGYRVSWYEIKSEPGLDATVYSPQVDFKFRNDTDSYLLIQTQTDLKAGTLTFRFYGTPTSRQIDISNPQLANPVKHGPTIYEDDPTLPKGVTKQVDWAKDGVDVTITRTVTLSDTVIHRDVISSHYRPWQAVYKVGTK